MTPALALWAAAVLGIALGALAWHRAAKARARTARREQRQTWTVQTEAAIAEALAVAEHVDDNPAAEYALAALHRDIRRFERGEGGSTSLASVLVPVGLFAAGLLIVWWYAR